MPILLAMRASLSSSAAILPYCFPRSLPVGFFIACSSIQLTRLLVRETVLAIV